MEKKKKFNIARIDSNYSSSPVQEETKFKAEQFVSSVSGYKVKDKKDYPYVSYGNNGYQYEGLKDKNERSEKYNNDMDALNRQGNINRIPSYLRREDYNSGNVASYPDNERSYIPGVSKNKEVRVDEANYENSNTVEEDEEDIFEQLDKEESKENDYFEFEDNHLDESSYDDSNKETYYEPYDFNETSYEEVKPQTKPQDDYFERLKRYNPSLFEPKVEETYTESFESVKNPTPTSSYVPESRPVYSTYDEPIKNNFDLDAFKDIELEFINKDNVSVKATPTPTVHTAINVAPLVKKKKIIKYKAPDMNFLNKSVSSGDNDNSGLNKQREIIDKTLKDFQIGGHVCNYDKGPTISRFEVMLDPGVKVDKVTGIQNNLKMALSASAFRLEAPIRGKNTIGIEVDNLKSDVVCLGDLLTKEIINDGNVLNVPLGKDVTGRSIDLDITKMPHAMMCGTSGSGKSVCLNDIIISILYKAGPNDVKLILVDPKGNEFNFYEDLPHLATPVITDPKIASQAIRWAVDEMTRRYALFSKAQCRDIRGYNELCEENPQVNKLPYIVLIIDEFNDLMMTAGKDLEDLVVRIAQKARAAGIHLIIATQRPTSDVINGTIKANIAVRMAFKVKTQLDSRTILDQGGAEELLGKGDMLYDNGVYKTRIQAPFVSDKEIITICRDLRARYSPDYLFSLEDLKNQVEKENLGEEDVTKDDYFEEVARWVVRNNAASINRITKVFNIGFNRAQAIVTELENQGVVGPSLGTKQRNVLVNEIELEEILSSL